MKELSCNKRPDPVARMVRDLTAREFVEWLVEYHGLPEVSASTVELNLREQYKWHRLQGRLDRCSGAVRFIARLLRVRCSTVTLERPADPEDGDA